jgi:hypothetical protein
MKKDISKCYSDLYKRIRRLTPLKLYQDGYITNSQLRNQFANVGLNENLSFNYIKIKTDEGPNCVLHVLYFGDFLPQSWLKENWNEITGGCNSAYIKMCRGGIYNEKKLASYCIAQYCTGQSQFLRYSWSNGWAYQGFAKDWEAHKWLLRNDSFESVCKQWNEYLDFKKRRTEQLLLMDFEEVNN